MQQAVNKDTNPSVSSESPPKYPSDGWFINLTRMPFFTLSEMNEHISKSGKNINSNTSTHSVTTTVRKATTFLEDEYLKEILAASDDTFLFQITMTSQFQKE